MLHHQNLKNMKNSLKSRKIFTITFFIVSGTILNCYSQQDPKNIAAGGSVILEYKYQSENPVSYLSVSKMIQTMDIQGQSMQNNVNSVLGCTIKTVDKQDKNLKLEVRIDTLGQFVDSPMGTSGRSVSEVQGKVFNIIIAPDGRGIDLSGAQQIVYSMESGETNMAQSFLEFFPFLPKTPVKTGETWNMVDTVSGKSATMSMKNVINSDNKLEGVENIDGIECARISSNLTGTMTIITQSQGMDIYIKGSFNGTGVVLFAIKEGYFIKQTGTTKMTGNIEISGPEAMSFPVIMDIDGVSEIKK